MFASDSEDRAIPMSRSGVASLRALSLAWSAVHAGAAAARSTALDADGAAFAALPDVLD
jgi:hypothetical protein